MTDADLLDALRDCYDPLLRRNIVELRMVRAAHLRPDPDAPGMGIAGISEKYRADIILITSSTDEDAAAQLVAQISNRLAGLPYISHVNVTLLPPVFPILHAKVK